MAFTLPNLPYGYDALAPFADEDMTGLHHELGRALADVEKKLAEKEVT